MGFFDTLGDLAGNAAQVYSQVSAKPATTVASNPVAANPVASPKTDWQQYIPWAIGAAVVVLLLVVFTGRRR